LEGYGDVFASLAEPSSMLSRSGNVFSSRELADVTEAGGVGDTSLRFFDSDGKTVKTPLDDRVIGMTLDELAKVDRVMALAGGESKTDAIRGALRTGVIDLLITDRFTAERLIGEEYQVNAVE
jgi:DNA-binding transcriptional regulator LsrR (DeoR family)